MMLYQGDCLEIMPDIPDKSIDMILTDPPYGTTACKWDAIIPLDLMWKELKRIIKDNGAIVLFGSEPFSSYLRISNIKDYKYDWYWNKGQGLNFVTAKHRPLNDTECVMVFGLNKIKYYPIMEDANIDNIRPINKGSSASQIQGTIKQAKSREGYNNNIRFPKTSININSRDAECNSIVRLHPTQKPVALMEYLIKTYTNENETVLDFTMGSGTTGVACKLLNRGFIGIELDEKYFQIAKERINKAVYQPELFIPIDEHKTIKEGDLFT